MKYGKGKTVKKRYLSKGITVWHVKQLEDGTSWLLYPKELSFENDNEGRTRGIKTATNGKGKKKTVLGTKARQKCGEKKKNKFKKLASGKTTSTSGAKFEQTVFQSRVLLRQVAYGRWV